MSVKKFTERKNVNFNVQNKLCKSFFHYNFNVGTLVRVYILYDAFNR